MRIEVRDLCYVYNSGLPDETRALDGVTFAVESGSFTGIIGHTGSGKTTLAQQLNGLLKPSSGQIFVGEVEITGSGVSLTEIRRRVGLVFQYPEYQLFEETVAEDIAFGPRNLGLEPEAVEERVRVSMDLVGLDYDTFAGKSPFTLSGGQKRRVAIAGVLAMEPSVLILDEPAAGLDPRAHAEILEMIGGIREKKGTTILLVSHNMEDVARYCDQVLVMDRGRLMLSGTPEEVFSHERELEESGLDLPAGRRLLKMLRDRKTSSRGSKWLSGLAAEEVLTEEQAAEAIIRHWKGKS